MVKNLSCSAEDVGSIPGCGTKILHAMGQLSLWPTTTETWQQKILHEEQRSHVLQLRPDLAK